MLSTGNVIFDVPEGKGPSLETLSPASGSGR